MAPGLVGWPEGTFHTRRDSTSADELDGAMADTRLGPPERPIPADKTRQGEIILRTPIRRAIFIAGLVGAVILPIVFAIWSRL